MTSARAVDESTIKAMWEFMRRMSETERKSVSRAELEERPELWGGRNLRIMLHALYVISMVCLLRYDEALHILWRDVEFQKLPDGKFKLTLKLPFRKTHQNGGM